MKKTYLLIVLLIQFGPTFSQKEESTLLTINGEKFSVSDFKRVYEKNLNAIDNEEAKDITRNLDLFINFKLKVKQAYDLKLDTLNSYKREIDSYRNQLMTPYLQDKEFLNSLIKEAYDRTKNEIRASHILIKFPKNYLPKDTLIPYNKIMEARERVLSGEDFELVAKEMSDDPSVKVNGGDLGYFSAFKMLYNFENIAYKTPVGEVSKPFKTRYGYHILKNTGSRPSIGERKIAHILIVDTTKIGKSKIDEVYSKLNNGASFEKMAQQYSNDRNTKNKGGVLPKFGSGRMVKVFEDVSFSLTDTNEISKPFMSRFGWHIIKLIKKYPVLSFDQMEKEITDKVRKTGRARLSDQAVLNRLKKEYNIIENDNAKKIFETKNFKNIAKDSLQEILLTINNKKITQSDLASYLTSRRREFSEASFTKFMDNQILSYFKDNLVYTNKDFAYTLKEYEEGLLLFELMQQKIWNKSSDSLALSNYYNLNKNFYQNKELVDVKGKVMNDFQTYLEDNWIKKLRSSNDVKINKRVLKKLINYYRRES